MAVTRTMKSYTVQGNVSTAFWRDLAQDLASFTGLSLVEKTYTASSYEAWLSVNADDKLFVRLSASSGNLNAQAQRSSSASATANIGYSLSLASLTSSVNTVNVEIISIDSKFFVFAFYPQGNANQNKIFAVGTLEDGVDDYPTVMWLVNSSTSSAREVKYYDTSGQTTRSLYLYDRYGGATYYHVDSDYNLHTFVLTKEPTVETPASFDDIYMMPHKLYCRDLGVYARPGGAELYVPTAFLNGGTELLALLFGSCAPYTLDGKAYQPIDSVQTVEVPSQT